MLSNKKQTGFTVVETLIVVAVTGMLFMSTSLLIRGKVAATSYQDSMRQLQQMVQNTINDVENGYLEAPNGTSLSEVVVGKRFWFCEDRFTIPTSPTPTYCGDSGGSLMRTETVVKDVAATGPPPAGLSYSATRTVSLPGNLKFRYFKSIINNNGDVLAGVGSSEFGAQADFTDASGYIGTENPSTVVLFNRPAAYQLGKNNSPDANPNIYGRILCFEGYKMGSLELGSAKSGTTVSLNIEDPRCN